MGCNLHIEMVPGMGHNSYLAAWDLLVAPALAAFGPELIVSASGLGANGFAPLARMQAHSGTFRALTERAMAAAQAHCGGRLVVVHEGGYAEAVVPFCGFAIVETLAGHRTAVEDPTLPMTAATQPARDVGAFQLARLQAQARALVSGLRGQPSSRVICQPSAASSAGTP